MKAERLLRQIRKRRVQPVERLADADAGGIARRADFLDAAHAGESFRAHHAGREAAAFLVHPGDDDRCRARAFRPRPAIAIDGLQRRHHAGRAVELAAGRLAVEMTADEQRRRRADRAPRKRQEQIAGRIGRRRRARPRAPSRSPAPGLDLALGQAPAG